MKNIGKFLYKLNCTRKSVKKVVQGLGEMRKGELCMDILSKNLENIRRCQNITNSINAFQSLVVKVRDAYRQNPVLHVTSEDTRM